MIDSVLVANRGEIACRVIRTCKKLGIRSIAIYHPQDQLSPHVMMADESYALSGAVPVQSYLDAAQIIEIAKRAGAKGIHPGYGFLSENAQFAKQVADHGMVFIGPTPEVIELMGNKLGARQFVEQHDFPLAPACKLDELTPESLQAVEKIGLPLLIKAASGGGGKGMSIVRDMAKLPELFALAQGEAQRYFNDKTVYIEKYIDEPRHIEVQVFADGHGNVVHLFERECSIQRRFQKVIEETPAPNMSDELRTQICETAADIARKANYLNAGTVEFILAPDGKFYFLEMNTRLQVEHPVTEMITGLDLVEWQLRVASGEKLPLNQSQITRQGHAMECRICAENPDDNFMPSTGEVGVLDIPTVVRDADEVRFDGGIAIGQKITTAFDSMLAKLIVYNESGREENCLGMAQALQGLVLLGVQHNADFLQRIVKHPEFMAGHLHTGFIAQYAHDLKPKRSPQDEALGEILTQMAQPKVLLQVQDTPTFALDIGSWRNA